MAKQVKTRRVARSSRIAERKKELFGISRDIRVKNNTISRTNESKAVRNKGAVRVYTSQQIIELKRIVQSVNSARK